MNQDDEVVRLVADGLAGLICRGGPTPEWRSVELAVVGQGVWLIVRFRDSRGREAAWRSDLHHDGTSLAGIRGAAFLAMDLLFEIQEGTCGGAWEVLSTDDHGVVWYGNPDGLD